MGARREWQPCQRAGGELREQRWAGTTRWKEQLYHRWVCKCDDANGKSHVNRVLHFSGASMRYATSEASTAFMQGRSIFGQTLQRR